LIVEMNNVILRTLRVMKLEGIYEIRN